MKTTMMTLAATAVLSVLSVNASSKNYSGLYKNTIVNEETRTKITEVYQGNGQSLTPIQKYEVKMDAYDNPVEKVVYEWENGAWSIMHKYAYTISNNGQVELLAYAKWSDKKNAWTDMQYAIYSDNFKLLAEY